MGRKIFLWVSGLAAFICSMEAFTQVWQEEDEVNTDSILAVMYRVNDHFLSGQWKGADRNWIRGTYYTGLMAFYGITEDQALYDQARNWGAKHGWRTGTEWTYPANRMTCVQTYLELYFLTPDNRMIQNARESMDGKIKDPDPASEQGWDYVDALYVGTPAYIMMSEATGDPRYADYGHRMFRDVYNDLYDQQEHLFYRDAAAISDKSRNGRKVLWSRGNGWAFASLPRILMHLDVNDSAKGWYRTLFSEMASSLVSCQGKDGFWRTNLADPADYPAPESSGTAFFIYGLAWGINNGYLEGENYTTAIRNGWHALYSCVSSDGKVHWGQVVSRKPGDVQQTDSHEYVSGAFLLAASEMYKFLKTDGKF